MVKTRLVESSHTIQKTAPAAGSGHHAPEFTKMFNDLRVRAGEPCNIQLNITASPKPQVCCLYNSIEYIVGIFLLYLLIIQWFEKIVIEVYCYCEHCCDCRWSGSSTTIQSYHQITKSRATATPTVVTSLRCLKKMPADSLLLLKMRLVKLPALLCWLLSMKLALYLNHNLHQRQSDLHSSNHR